MKAQLLIEQLPNDYLLASVKAHGEPTYVTNPQGRPLKFLNVDHIKEFFAGQRIDEIYLINSDGVSTELECW